MKKLVFALLISLSSFSSFSEEHVIKMLNAGKEGMMVFEPAVITISKGDTVKFLSDNGIGIAGIEIIIDELGNVWTYDVNTNTNYNPQAEKEAGISAPLKIAEYLNGLRNKNNFTIQSGSLSG